MTKYKDPRINAVSVTLKEYLALLVMLAALSAIFMVSMRFFIDRGMLESNVSLVRLIIDAYIFLIAALFMAIMAFFRHRSWSRPMRAFGEAARKTAMGDFRVRIPPLRKDGKKDFIEVMFDDFNTMVHELAGIETMRNDFITNVSHEIKTPLSLIQSYATALQDDTLKTEERREYTQTIIEAAQKLSLLVTNILKLNKLENQGIAPKAQPFDLSEQLRQCAASFAEQWEQKNISFEADIDEVKVSYDESLLEIIWNNLLSNAVKFSRANGKIYIILKVKENFVSVSITDNGVGMDKATQRHIFDKFYQGDSSHASEGNGLGLALVKKSVELLGGTISVDSVLGQGTTFMVSLRT